MGFLSKLFGNKASRDNKALQPLLQKTLDAYEKIKDLDIDSLRHKTVEFREYIKNYIAEYEAKIDELKASVDANPDMDLEKKNDIYEQVDKLEKKVFEKIDEALDNIMPEAFAVLKEVARRFKDNEVVEATATDITWWVLNAEHVDFLPSSKSSSHSGAPVVPEGYTEVEPEEDPF